jgi:hypothetical protein
VILGHAGEPFLSLHRAHLGPLPEIHLDNRDIPSHLRELVLDTWSFRVETEYRSVQVMTRFLTETLGAGDPLEVHAAISEAIRDELRHVSLCAAVVEALGHRAPLPTPVTEDLSPEFFALPMAQRALTTAITMLLINETLSVALLEDLRQRATHPAIAAVLEATLTDEDTHEAFGTHYVKASLARFDEDGRAWARALTRASIEGHRASARSRLGSLSPALETRNAHPEPELAHWGLMSPTREAIIVLETLEQRLAPRLVTLGLD